MPTSRPPDCVVFVARTHWLTGGVIFVSVGLLHAMTFATPVLQFGATAYVIGIGLGALYLTTGTAVWLGWRVGPALHGVATILFLPRPALGRRLWEIGRSEEFKSHFGRNNPETRI